MMALIVTSDGFLSTLSLRRATGLPTVPGVPGQHFYPRSPCGERRCYFLHFSALLQFLSTLSLRRATGFNQPQRRLYAISIHALLAESDWLLHRVHTQRRNFYPRSPCGERRLYCCRESFSSRYFYPRSPCGERLEMIDSLASLTLISIHALLAESDHRCADLICAHWNISIHALLAESDMLFDLRFSHLLDFYPRSPCGERRQYSRQGS